MPKSTDFRIRYHKVEGDVKEVLSEIIQEKVKSALSTDGQYRYYGGAIPVSNYINYQGEIGNEQGSGISQGEYNEGGAEAQSRTSKDEV